jgi:hypothetical protein
VLIRAANVRRDNFENDAVLDLFAAGGIFHFWEIDRFNFNFTRLDVRHTTILRHDNLRQRVLNSNAFIGMRI